MADGVVVVDSSTFDETVRGSSTPVLVDFWAEWCGPCKQIAPVLESIAGEEAGRITIAKLDVDANGDVAQRFGVMSIPTLILFKDGEPVGRWVGALSKSKLTSELAPHL
jgi:thioredoxin 1